jgi:uncharacterized membrane protein
MAALLATFLAAFLAFVRLGIAHFVTHGARRYSGFRQSLGIICVLTRAAFCPPRGSLAALAVHHLTTKERTAMHALVKFAHLAAAIVWMGGMAFMLLALRPALGVLPPPHRLPLVAGALQRFFALVWTAIAVLLASGAVLLMNAGRAPLGWHVMAGLGLVMFAVFAHLFFAPYRRLRRAVDASDWPAAGAQMQAIPRLAMANFVLGWIAIAAVRFL